MRIENIQLNLIRTFIEVCKDRNITLTSERLNLDTSTIIKQLKQLENEFGKKLYIGHAGAKKGIEITDSGKILYEGFNKAYNMLLLTEKRFNEVEDIENGKLSIGIKEGIKDYYLDYIIEKFIDVYPNLTIKFFESNSHDLVSRLQNYNVDLIIGDINSDNGNITSNNIIRDSLCYAYSKTLTPDFSSKLDLILPVKENSQREIINLYLKNNNIDYKIKYEFSDSKSIVEYIKKGKGIGIIPKKIADISNLKTKTIDKLDYNINILYIKENLSGSAKEFLEFLTKQV